MNIKFLCLVVLLCVVHVGVSRAQKSESKMGSGEENIGRRGNRLSWIEEGGHSWQ